MGLGAGNAKVFRKHYPEANIDIAEIDADMLAVAQKYFYFKEMIR